MNWVGEVAEVHYYVLMKDELRLKQVYINLNEFRSDINTFGTNCYINMRLTTKALTKQKGPKCFLGCSKNTCIFAVDSNNKENRCFGASQQTFGSSAYFFRALG